MVPPTNHFANGESTAGPSSKALNQCSSEAIFARTFPDAGGLGVNLLVLCKGFDVRVPRNAAGGLNTRSSFRTEVKSSPDDGFSFACWTPHGVMLPIYHRRQASVSSATTMVATSSSHGQRPGTTPTCLSLFSIRWIEGAQVFAIQFAALAHNASR